MNQKPEHERKSRHVSLRFTTDEYGMIRIDAQRTSLTMQDYCSAAILGRARDKVHVEPERSEI